MNNLYIILVFFEVMKCNPNLNWSTYRIWYSSRGK